MSNDTTNQVAAETDARSGRTDELLTFVVEAQSYGVDILRVEEIRGWESVTRIPNTPDYVKGVLNLRGAIVPIIDLRTRLGLPAVEYGKTTVIVVLQVLNEDGSRIMGIVVDAVSDVSAVESDKIQEAPQFGSDVDTRFIRGMVNHGESLITILEVDRLLSAESVAVELGNQVSEV